MSKADKKSSEILALRIDIQVIEHMQQGRACCMSHPCTEQH